MTKEWGSREAGAPFLLLPISLLVKQAGNHGLLLLLLLPSLSLTLPVAHRLLPLNSDFKAHEQDERINLTHLAATLRTGDSIPRFVPINFCQEWCVALRCCVAAAQCMLPGAFFLGRVSQSLILPSLSVLTATTCCSPRRTRSTGSSCTRCAVLYSAATLVCRQTTHTQILCSCCSATTQTAAETATRFPRRTTAAT